MFAAMARARQLGLMTRAYIVLWVRAPRTAARGCTVVASDSVRVYLRDDLGLHETYLTMLHELAHVSDAAILGALGDVAEERADAFIARASQAASRPWRLMLDHLPTTGSGKEAVMPRPTTASTCRQEISVVVAGQPAKVECARGEGRKGAHQGKLQWPSRTAAPPVSRRT